MVDIFGMTLEGMMTLEVISRPINIQLLRLCHFLVFLQLLLDMVLLLQIFLKTDFCTCCIANVNCVGIAFSNCFEMTLILLSFR